MVEVLDTVTYQLYERRLDACLEARDRCGENTWGWTFWQNCFTILLRKMNKDLHRCSVNGLARQSPKL